MGRSRTQLLALFLFLALVKSWGLAEQGLWIDEGHTWRDAVTGDVLNPQGTTPLWTAISAAALRLLPGWPAELSLRLPALLCGLVALAVLAFLAPLPERRARLTVLLLAGTHPLLYWHDQDARMYSLLFLCSALLVTALLRRAAGQPRGTAALALITAVAGCYTHPYMLVLAGSAWLWLVLSPGLFTRRAALASAVVAGIALLPLALHYGSAVARHASAGVAASVGARVPDLLLALLQALFGATTFSRQHLPLFTFIVLPFALAAVAILTRSGWRASRLRLLPVLVLLPVAVTLLAGAAGCVAVLPRYFIVALPALFLLLAAAPPGFINRAALLLLLALNCLGIYHIRCDPRFAREDWRGLATLAQSAAAQGIVIGLPGEPPHVLRYYAGQPPAFATADAGTDPVAWLGAAPPGARLLVLYHGFRRPADRLRGDQRFVVREFSRLLLVTLDTPTAGGV